MNVSEMKEYIYNNHRIVYILNELGCKCITPSSPDCSHVSRFTCTNPDGDNQRAIEITNNKYLNVRDYTRDLSPYDDSGNGTYDIITLVRFCKGLSFVEAITYLHTLLDLPYNGHYKAVNSSKFDPLEVFYDSQKSEDTEDQSEHGYLSESTLSAYEPILYDEWFKEGIMERTRKKFDIRYNYDPRGIYDAIIIPLREWSTGRLLGIKKRYTNKITISEKGKYNNPKNYRKSENIYGLFENYDSIKNAGYVVVFESEKSILKRHSLKDETGVALSGHSISDKQVEILVSLGVEVVIAFDKDISEDEVRFNCEKFYGLCKVSYIIDNENLLEAKDSPADQGNKVYPPLFENPI